MEKKDEKKAKRMAKATKRSANLNQVEENLQVAAEAEVQKLRAKAAEESQENARAEALRKE